MTAILSAASFHGPVLGLRSELRVRAVFERAWHLQDSEDRVLTVGAVPYNGPMAIRVPRPSLTHLPVRPGMPATMGQDALDVGPVRVDLRTARAWSPYAATLRTLDRDALAHDLTTLHACILERTVNEDFSPWQVHIKRKSARLHDALVRDDIVQAQDAAIGLLGLGPGLTPTGDDILCGLLAGLRILSRRAALSVPLPEPAAHLSRPTTHDSQLTTPLVDAARTATTPLSRTLLTWAGHGVATQPLLDVLWSLGSGGPVNGLEALLAIGHTSGRDMLAGAVLAASALRRREETSGSALAGPTERLS